MPIYEYQCSACGHQMEALQRLSDAPLTDCPACDGATLRKKISAAGFRLKGGGWYETDFKTGGNKEEPGRRRGQAQGGWGKEWGKGGQARRHRGQLSRPG